MDIIKPGTIKLTLLNIRLSSDSRLPNRGTRSLHLLGYASLLSVIMSFRPTCHSTLYTSNVIWYTQCSSQLFDVTFFKPM